MFLRKGDTVKVLTGKDRGKTGKVLTVGRKSGRIAVEGLHLITRHTRPRRQGEKGQKIQVPRAVDPSNLMLICPNCGKSTRASYAVDDKGVKSRICKQCSKRL